MTIHRYHAALVVLHWLLGFMILLGLIMGTFSLEPLSNSQPEKLDSLRGHMINGLAIGVLMIVRLIVRSLTHQPAPPSTGFSWTKRVGRRVHLTLMSLSSSWSGAAWHLPLRPIFHPSCLANLRSLCRDPSTDSGPGRLMPFLQSC